MRYPFQWPRVPLNQFFFASSGNITVAVLGFEVIAIFQALPNQMGGRLSVADRALEVWASIKKSVRYWEGLSKLKRPKNSSYECLVSN